MIITIASGYFNPIHKGHIEYLHKASKLGELIVIVNNDEQVKIKGSVPFQCLEERMAIVSALKCVDNAVPSIDEDATVCNTIERIVLKYQKENPDTKFIFAKGGDRTENEIPEKEVCDKYKIKIIDGLGEKIQSSSDLIEQCQK